MSKINMATQPLDYECSEAFKTLRTNLQFCGSDKKAIVFTSCTPDEGKSAVILRLAASLAEAGKRVLLVDADLRKSVMAGNFTIPQPVKGLTHYLAGQAEKMEVICNTENENFDVILAGPVPPNPAELLGEEQFKSLLEWGREQYDYVLIDSAPLGSVIDSAIIADKCDGAVIVVEAEVISYRFVQEIREQLEKSNCQVLGIILNKVDIREQKYYYNRYYGRKYG
ncbi:MAG: polysaccharide biosynthesis tyrosine autokinase, partial [Eubacteriales bacterium]|nr:polysaccharide biosynthesis tyrosine autokinase [Eubacteriales bacterium]